MIRERPAHGMEEFFQWQTEMEKLHSEKREKIAKARLQELREAVKSLLERTSGKLSE